MKKLTLLSVFVLLSAAIFAQQTISFSDYVDEKEEFKTNDQEIRTVMNSFTVKRISGFGGPTVSYSSINGDMAIMSGGGGGVIINNVFLGGYGEGLSNSIGSNADATIRNLEFGHGGFWLGYEIAPHKMIHPVISSRIGWGTASGINQDNRRISDNIFVVVPTVSAEINFTRFFKMNIGAEYRRVFDLNVLDGYSNNSFSNVGVYMNFMFGWF